MCVQCQKKHFEFIFVMKSDHISVVCIIQNMGWSKSEFINYKGNTNIMSDISKYNNNMIKDKIKHIM